MYHNYPMLMTGAPKATSARIGGVELHWAEVGQGPPIVLLHGLSDSHRTWAKVAPVLARTRRVLMPDLPGHGQSDRPDASYALEWHADIIGKWMDELGLQEIDLVGHSFGGGVAQWILLAHRARVRRLALVAAGGLGRDVSTALRLCSLPYVVEHLGQPFMALGTRIAMRSAGAGFDPGEIQQLAWMNARPGSARALARSVRDVIDWQGQHRHFLDRASEIGELPPTALFWGDKDLIIPSSHGTDTMGYLENVTMTRFEGCGHFPHRESPLEFTRALESFIDAPSWRPAVMSSSWAYRRPHMPFFRRAWRAIKEVFRGHAASRASRFVQTTET